MPERKNMKAKVLNRKKLIVCLAAIALIIAVTLALLFSCGNQGSGKKATLPSDSKNIMRMPPENGETPDDHGGVDNIAFIIGRLAMRDMYHTETAGNVVAKVLFIEAGQTIYGSKDYKDGILLTSSVSISNNQFAPSKAIQRFYGDGKVVVRGSASSDKNTWTGSDVEWSDEAPLEILDEAQYEERYGLWASEFADYVINEETILSVSDLGRTEEGLYTLEVELDPSTSVAYYVHQMKTMGGLDEYPKFSSVMLTFTFGADWTIYSLGIDESYSSKKGVDASCRGQSVITFSYDEASVDVSAYETYFKQYADAATVEEAEKEYTAEDYLTYGFAAFLNDVVYLDADLSVCGQHIPARIALDMRGLSLNSLKVAAGDLSFAYAEEKVYINYRDFSGYIGIDDAMSLMSLMGGLSADLDTDALMQSVMNAEIVKDGESVSLLCSLDLGGLTVPVRFGFTEKQTESGREVSFGYIAAELEISGLDIGVTAKLSDDKTEIAVDENATDLYPFIENIADLVSGKKFALGVSYDNAEIGLAVSGAVNADLTAGIALGGDICVRYGDMQIPVGFTYAGDTVYVSVYDVKVSATLTELSEVLEAALAAAGAQLPELPDLSGVTGEAISSIVSSVIGLDYGAIIKELTLTGEGFALGVDLDALIAGLTGEETSLGDLCAAYDLKENEFSVSVAGAEVTLGGTDAAIAEPADKDSYVSLSRLTQFIEPVQAIMDSNGAAFELSFAAKIGEYTLQAAVAGEVRIADAGGLASLLLNIDLILNGGKTQQLNLYYADGSFVLGFNGYKMAFTPEETARVQKEISALLGGGVADEGMQAAMSLFGEDGLDLNALLDGLKLVSESESAIGVIGDLSSLLGAGNENISVVLALPGGGKISASVSEITAFGLTVSGLNAFVAPVTEECAGDMSFLGWAECDNLFEFVLAAYSAFSDAEYLETEVSLTSGTLSLQAEGTLQLDAEVDAENNVSVTVNFDIKAAIADGASHHYLAATLLNDMLWASYSTVGFGAAGALNISIPVSDLFVTAGSVWPVIGSLVGVGDTAYYYNFVSSILNGYEQMSEYYNTVNSDIFGLPLYGDKSAFDAWLDIFLGIADEYAPDGTEAAAETKALSDIAVSFDAEKAELVLSGEGLYAALRANAEGSVTAPAGNYMDLSSLSKLAKTIMASITTEQTVEAPDGSVATTAKINDYYYLSGKVTASVLGYTIDIQAAISVTVKEDGGVKVNVHLDIPGSALVVVLINGNTALDITIEDGMVYMERTQTTKQGVLFSETLAKPIVLYRVSTLDNFLGDILSHLSFMFNFGSTIANQIPSEPSASTGGADAGEILTSFAYDGSNGQKWSVGLNLSSLTDGALAESTVTLNAGADGVLSSLGFSSSVYGFVSLSADIGYVNPGESMESGRAQDVTSDVGQRLRPLYGAALETTDWSKVSYIEGAPAALTYTAEGRTLSSQSVAYDTATGAVLTQLVLPDLSAFNQGGYTYSWGALGQVYGDTEYRAQKTPNVYTVSLYSAYEIDGYSYDHTDGGSFVYVFSYTYGTRLELPVGAESAKTYEIARITDDTGAAFSAVEGILSDLTLEAEWAEIEYEVTYTVFGETVAVQKYGYGEALVLPDEYAVNGYVFAGWNSDAQAVVSDMTIEGVYAVSVTLASDLAAEGFTAGENGWYKEIVREGTVYGDFVFADAAQVSGYTQFGWWLEEAGGYAYVDSLAGLDGKTLWALWVSDFTASSTTASKKNTSGFDGWLYSIKYDYTVTGTYTGGEVSGTVGQKIAAAIGLTSEIRVEGKILYNSKNHSFSVTAGAGGFTAAAYLTNGAAGSPYVYEISCGDFNRYELSVQKTFTCDLSGVSFNGFASSLEGGF